MSAKLPQVLTVEDRWLVESVATLANLVEPVGPLAAAKLRWLSETRSLLKEVSSFLAQELPIRKFAYEDRAAMIGPIESTIVNIGVKLLAGLEALAEPEIGAMDEINPEAGAEIEDERIVQQAEAEQPAEPELAEEGADPNEDGVKDAADIPEEPAEEDAVEEAVEPADEAAGPVEAAEPVEEAAEPVVKAVVPGLFAETPGDVQEHVTCFYCEQRHPLCKCPALQRQDGKQRRATIIDLGVCFNCFSKKHRVFYCPILVGRCLKCPKRHHTLLHGLV